MAKIYVYMVIDGLKKWTDIKPKWRDTTCQMLRDMNYILNDDGTVSEPQE